MIKVFFSYAREDEERLSGFLKSHMAQLEQEKWIEQWLDRDKILPGDDWRAVIETAVAAADVVVLFLSNSFFSSAPIRELELQPALRREARGEVKVVPVLVGPVRSKSLQPLERLHIVPGPTAPVYGEHATAAMIEHMWVRVGEAIEGVVDRLSGLADVRPDVAAELRAFRKGLDPAVIEQLGRPVVGGCRKLESKRNTTGYRWEWRSGSIYWSPSGTFAVCGPIAARHEERGGCRGSLGFPVSNEAEVPDAAGSLLGRCQRFEGMEDRSGTAVRFGASIYHRSGDKAAYATTGGVGEAYESRGGPAGPLGMPTGPVRAVTSGAGTNGWWQAYERGAVYVLAGRGAHTVLALVADAHRRLGGVEGRFGFPVGSAVTAEGHTTQEFEGGAIAAADDRPAGQPSHPTIAAGSFREGHQEQFLALPDGRIFHRWAYDGDGWWRWTSFFDTTARLPVRLTTLSKREGEFGIGLAEGNDAAVRLRWYRPPTPGADKVWSEWETVPTPRPVVSLASGSYASDHQELFAVLDDGNVFHRWQWDSHDWLGWSRWSWFATPVPMRRVVCGSPEPKALEVFALGTDRRLYATSHHRGARWSEWEPCEGLDGEVVAHTYGVRRDGHRELIVALDDGRVVHRWCHGDRWTDWRSLGTVQSVVDLAVASRTGDQIEVVAVTTADKLTHRRLDGGRWSPWEDVGLP